ncbi:MAG: hypothetical protein ABI675_30965 [Chitinophagaceae bacterium]
MILDKPIKFSCLVDGKNLEAELLESIEHPIQHAFRIRFSDGYEDEFWGDPFTPNWWEGSIRKKSRHLAAIKEDLNSIISIHDGFKAFCLRWKIDGIMTNVWVIENIRLEDEQLSGSPYSVRCNSGYRFSMIKSNGKWMAKSIRVIDSEEVNTLLVAEIGKLIDQNS